MKLCKASTRALPSQSDGYKSRHPSFPFLPTNLCISSSIAQSSYLLWHHTMHKFTFYAALAAIVDLTPSFARVAQYPDHQTPISNDDIQPETCSDRSHVNQLPIGETCHFNSDCISGCCDYGAGSWPVNGACNWDNYCWWIADDKHASPKVATPAPVDETC